MILESFLIFESEIFLESVIPASISDRAKSLSVYAPAITRGPKKSPFPLSSIPKWGSNILGKSCSS